MNSSRNGGLLPSSVVAIIIFKLNLSRHRFCGGVELQHGVVALDARRGHGRRQPGRAGRRWQRYAERGGRERGQQPQPGRGRLRRRQGTVGGGRGGSVEPGHRAELPGGVGHLPAVRATEDHTVRRGHNVR